MKHRTGSKALRILLSLVLVLGLMAGTVPGMGTTYAYTDADRVGLWVNNEHATDSNTSGENWSYDPTTNTLTLSDYHFDGVGSSPPNDSTVIMYYDYNKTLTIVLNGTNTIVQGDGTNKTWWGIYSRSDLVIQGDGTLDVSTRDGGTRGAAIYAEKNLSIAGNCTLTATSGSVTGSQQGYGIGGGSSSVLTIGENANVTLIGPKGGTNLTVKNDVPGTGWTDTAGTQGEAAIATSAEGQSLSSFKKVQFLPPVAYLDASGATQSITDYTVVTDSTTTWNAGWYVVNSNVAITGRITCSGDVNLILCDNASLTVTDSDTGNGGAIQWGDNTGNFTIYAQSTGNDMGSLTAIHSDASYGYGICVNQSSLTINGGNVTAQGGYDGIWVRNNITINGGIVNAATNSSLYGSILSLYGNIAIHGGTVHATGGKYGIDAYGNSNYVLIEGGTVTAVGDTGAFRYNVKNTIAGTGWTDTAGTQGEAAIATSAEGQSLSSYKKVQFPALVASVTAGETTTEYTDFAAALSAWNSAADGATLTLLDDVETASSISVSGTKTLDLNGYGIRATGAGYSIFTVGSSADLTVEDGDNTRAHAITLNDYRGTSVADGTGTTSVTNGTGTAYITGGYITGARILGDDDNSGGGFTLNGKLKLNGGSVIGNWAQNNGGGLVVKGGGTFELDGGAICYNYGNNGGAIRSDGTVTLTSGFVSYNKGGWDCGGVFATSGTCTLAGAEISYNTKTDVNGYGGGVGINAWDAATVNLTGGSVIGNIGCKGNDRGVSANNLTISGNVTITGNKATTSSTAEANLYISTDKKVNITGTLTNAMPIGVTMQTPGVFTSSSDTSYNDASKFTSDNASYAVGKNAAGQLLLGTPFTVTLSGGANAAATGGATTQSVVGEMAAVTYTPNDGYYFDYAGETQNGVTAALVGDNIVVSGTPTGNVSITIPDAVEDTSFKPEFCTQSLLLSGQIGVNFYMDLSGLTEEQRAASWMEFTVSGKGGTTAADAYDAGHTNKSGAYYGFTCYVNSIQMADTITAVYHYSDVRAKTVTKTYSVKEYLDTVAAYDDFFTPNMRTLGVTMSDYGYYAQQYLSNLRGFTLGEGQDHEAMPAGTAYTADDKTAVVDAVSKYGAVIGSSSDIEAVSYLLLLDSSTGIYIYLTPKAGYTGSVTAALADDAKTCATEQLGDGRYRIHIPGISTHELAETYTVTVTTDSGAFDVSLSALSYVTAMLNSGDNAARDNALVALYRYYDSAMTFAGRAH